MFPTPDQDVNILGDVWTITVLANYSAALDHRHLDPVLYFQSCFVSFLYLWWFATWSWRHGLWRRYDPAQQKTSHKVSVTIDTSFTTEQVVVGRIDEIHILSAVRAAPRRILVPLTDLWHLYLVVREKTGHGDDSRYSRRFPDKGRKGVCSLVWPTSSLPFSICPSRKSVIFFFEKFYLFFQKNSGPIPVNRRCLLHPHFRAHV